MKHLRKFESLEAMQTEIAKAAVDFIGLAYDTEGGTANVRIAKEINPNATPFYIDVRNTVTLAATSGLQMSTDGENWTNTVAGDLPTGKTYFRVASDQTSPLKPAWTEKSDSDYDIGGNINSLVKTSFKNDTTCYNFFNDNTYEGFFQNKAKLKSAGNLILPATTLTNRCYCQMFYSCRSLTTAPALPATTLNYSCYGAMFYNCTSLTTAPVLPATTLAERCYDGMFMGCTSLTTAPELPATTLADNCYQFMLRDCTSLTTAPELPATELTQNCYYGMFAGCTSLTTALELPATTLAYSCYSAMFQGCTALTAAPVLPATTLADDCYIGMFVDCTSLNYIKCLATDIFSSLSSITDWVIGVAANGTFVKNPSTSTEDWGTGGSGIPEGWTVQDATE